MSDQPQDAEFVFVEHRVRIPWGRLFLWLVGVVGCAAAALETTDRGEIVVFVVFAGLIWPLVSLFDLVTERVSDEAARGLRERLLTQPAKAPRRVASRR